MSQCSPVARGLLWLAASFMISAVAAGAPGKRGKAVAPTAVDLTDEHGVKPEEKAPEGPRPSAPSAPEGKTDHESDAPSPPSPPSPPHEHPSDADKVTFAASDDEAVARSDAARLAAGRLEVAVSVGVDVGSRRFTYSDPVGPVLARYRLPVVPMASFGLEAYPFASTRVPFLRDLGFSGRVSRAFAVESKTPDGAAIETSWTRFGGELRERMLVPSAHPFEFGIYAGADASYFGMSTTKPVRALIPAARTVSLRFGFDTRLFIAWRLSAMLGGAYLVTTSPGEIYDRFRDPHVAGLDADLGFAVAVTPGLEARLAGRYTRYFASFKPVLGDSLVAGGAVDEQMQFGLGVCYAH